MFNQLLFDLEAEVFGYFKDWAASTVLDKMFKRVYEARRGWGHYIPGRRRYEVRCQIEIDETVVGWGVATRYVYTRSTLLLSPSSRLLSRYVVLEKYLMYGCGENICCTR